MSQIKQYTVRVMETFQVTVTAESQDEAKEIIAKEIPKHDHAGIGGHHQRRHTFHRTYFVTPSGELSRNDPDYIRVQLKTRSEYLNRAQRDLDRAQCMDAPRHVLRKYEDDVEYWWEKVCDSKKELEAWEC